MYSCHLYRDDAADQRDRADDQHKATDLCPVGEFLHDGLVSFLRSCRFPHNSRLDLSGQTEYKIEDAFPILRSQRPKRFEQLPLNVPVTDSIDHAVLGNTKWRFRRQQISQAKDLLWRHTEGARQTTAKARAWLGKFIDHFVYCRR
jgi:hypothetical protein